MKLRIFIIDNSIIQYISQIYQKFCRIKPRAYVLHKGEYAMPPDDGSYVLP